MKKVLVLLLTVFLISCTANLTKVTVQTENGEITFNAKTANTLPQWIKGLQNVSSMPADQGMLFIFPDADVRRFWMKDTLIPLDIIFINDKRQIINIHHNVPPVPFGTVSDDAELEVYASETPAQYVLELNGGTAKEMGIKAGDTLNW